MTVCDCWVLPPEQTTTSGRLGVRDGRRRRLCYSPMTNTSQHNDTIASGSRCGPTLGVERKNRLDGYVHPGKLVRLKHHLREEQGDQLIWIISPSRWERRVVNTGGSLREEDPLRQRRDVIGYLDDLLSVLGGVHGRLGQQNLAVA